MWTQLYQSKSTFTNPKGKLKSNSEVIEFDDTCLLSNVTLFLRA